MDEGPLAQDLLTKCCKIKFFKFPLTKQHLASELKWFASFNHESEVLPFKLLVFR